MPLRQCQYCNLLASYASSTTARPSILDPTPIMVAFSAFAYGMVSVLASTFSNARVHGIAPTDPFVWFLNVGEFIESLVSRS